MLKPFLTACFTVLALLLVTQSSVAHAEDLRLSGPSGVWGQPKIQGDWVAWAGGSGIEWKNLSSDGGGVIPVSKAGTRRGPAWALAEGYLAWDNAPTRSEYKVYVRSLTTGDQWVLDEASGSARNLVGGEGSRLFWRDRSGVATTLHYFDLVTSDSGVVDVPPGASEHLSTSSFNEDWFVWADLSEPLPDSYDGGQGPVWAMNFDTGEKIRMGRAVWANVQGTVPTPVVDGDWVAWTCAVSADRSADKELHLYHLPTGSHRILDDRRPAPGDPVLPVIDQGWITWEDAQGGNIGSFYARLGDPLGPVSAVSDTAARQYFPNLDYPWLVWIDNRTGGFHVYARRLHNAAPPMFSDVSHSSYKEAIENLAERGIIRGYPDNTFGPDNPVLRAQFAKMVCGAFGLPVTESLVSPFSDLGEDGPDSLYPHDYITAVASYGITKGTGPTTFSPWADISRAQVVTMIVRAADNLTPGLLTQPPASYGGSVGNFSYAHQEAMQTAEYNGLLEGLVGFGPSWNPWQKATRGEVAEMLEGVE